jgi:DNA-binding NarL/FixJ family response regulator
MTARPIRLLICDDHPVVRSGLRGMLQSQPDFEVVAEASDGARAVDLTRRYKPDVVLMDLNMPEMDGVTAIGKIKAERPETEVLVLTTYETDADILRAVEEGATGYLLKDTSEENLFDAIRQAARGKSPLAPSVASRLVERIRSSSAGEDLTEREIEILRLVARGSNNKEIAQELLVSESTVKTHILHIFYKLGVTDRTAAVTTALRRGLIRLEP